MVDVEIRDNMIRLGQFVKLAGAVESGRACVCQGGGVLPAWPAVA